MNPRRNGGHDPIEVKHHHTAAEMEARMAFLRGARDSAQAAGQYGLAKAAHNALRGVEAAVWLAEHRPDVFEMLERDGREFAAGCRQDFAWLGETRSLTDIERRLRDICERAARDWVYVMAGRLLAREARGRRDGDQAT